MAEHPIDDIPKCYNSVSCIISVLVIVFILGSIVWDILFTRPEIQKSLNDIKTEISTLSVKIDDQNKIMKSDSIYEMTHEELEQFMQDSIHH